MDKKLVRISKFLSLVLRHKPEAAKIELDTNGWVDITVLLNACRDVGTPITRDQFDEIVATNEKKRFTVKGNSVRAAQGHSVNVNLGYKAVEPPEILYHGTAMQFVDAIKREGLKPQKRQHVHLSSNTETASSVGKRRGEAVILIVKAKEAHIAGISFYTADNGVWLADAIPSKFLKTEVR